MEQMWYQLFGAEHDITLAQECARAVLIFFYGLLMLRLSGRRTFADWSALDIILSIIIGSALSRALTGSAPLLGTMAAAAVLTALHVAIAYLVANNRSASRLIEGGSVILGANGQVDDGKRRSMMISECDLHEAFRAHGLDSASDTRKIVLEPSGKISILKNRKD